MTELLVIDDVFKSLKISSDSLVAPDFEPANILVVDLLSPPPSSKAEPRNSGRAPPRTRETMSPPHRKFPKALKNCAEVIELGKDAISYCLVRRAPAKHSPPPSRPHFIAQRRAVWDHTKCTSGRQPCPRAAVASRSFARSRRRRAERVRSGDDDVASGGGARIVHRRRGARAVLHVADAPVIDVYAHR